MKENLVRALAVMYLLLVACLQPAHAVLERVGPVSNAPAIGGFPAWYMDTSGIALEFCSPSAAEMDNGHCLLLPADASPPEQFPTSFADEHFFYAAGAVFPASPVTKLLWESAIEAAFGGAVVQGGQMTFARIRMRLDPVPVTGTYIFRHPYGEEVLQGVAGDRIFFTDDVGIGSPGDFTGAMTSRLGPFLLPSNSEGGDELPPVAGTGAAGGGAAGKFYIADPGREGPVTGGPVRNFVEIEGPTNAVFDAANRTGKGLNFISTNNFSLMGRLYTGQIAGQVAVDRASYTRKATGIKVDTFATAVPGASSRMPGATRPPAGAPTLSFFDVPCGAVTDAAGKVIGFTAPTGGVETQMVAVGNSHWGQTQPAALPDSVCVKDGTARDAGGNIVPAYFQTAVRDEITISMSNYDPSTQTLSVMASSSDEVVPPTLTLAGFGDLLSGQIAVSPLLAPSAKVQVNSSARGFASRDVNNGFGTASPPPSGPNALNDTFPVAEDSGANTLAVLGNDINVAGGTVNLVSLPRLGSAVVNGDGTVSYTPNLNVNGTDSFAYTVTVGANVSNVANTTVNITPVNDAPVVNNDSAATSLNTPINISVFANDTDVDGQADLANAVLVQGPGANATVTGGAGGVFNFNATVTGTYTFTYEARDTANTPSATTATVTVTVTAAEQVAIQNAVFRTSQSRWVVNGASSVAGGENITLVLTSGNPDAPCSNEGTVVGANPVDAAGALLVDVRPGVDPRGTSCLMVKAVSALGGVSPAFTFTVRR